MDFTKEVLCKIQIVNRVLDEIHAIHLLKNPDFSIDDMSMESWVKFNLNNEGFNRIPLSLTLTPISFEIRLERVSEAIDWSNKDLNESALIVATMLKNLFTSYILVEHYGSSRTLISLFGRDGKTINQFKYRGGFSLNTKREIQLFYPIYKTLAD